MEGTAMHIKLDTLDEIPDLPEMVLSSLMNHAKINVNKIRYNQEEKWVEIPLTRRMVGFRTTLLGRRPKYSKHEIQSLLRIRGVTNLHIHSVECLIEELEGVFTALFGLKIDEQAVHISSVEEISGRQLCKIAISLSKINIEFSDI